MEVNLKWWARREWSLVEREGGESEFYVDENFNLDDSLVFHERVYKLHVQILYILRKRRGTPYSSH